LHVVIIDTINDTHNARARFIDDITAINDNSWIEILDDKKKVFGGVRDTYLDPCLDLMRKFTN
jgi:hypothetical protein